MGKLSDLHIPVFWAEGQPSIDRTGYRVSIGGLVHSPLELDPARIASLATDTVSCRLTSVTRWSVRLLWRGILARRILAMASPLPAASFVKLTSAGGQYTTCVPIAALEHPRALFAVAADGEDLPVEYGGPLRAVFPHLWGYKSAKSIVAVEFRDSDEDGYWEVRGYAGDAAILPTRLLDLNSGGTRAHDGGEVSW
jgi:DMSO/TMAO reductase YedYZ molybdopterin-dependent catalytic subunit